MKKSKAQEIIDVFNQNPFDPLGMYGSFPSLINPTSSSEMPTPTQDADDL